MQRPKIFTSDSTPKDREKKLCPIGPRQQTGENRHQHYQSEEQRHSNLIELLYTGLDTPDYDKSTKQQENRVEKQRSVRLRDKIGKLRTEMTGIRRSQRQRKGLEQVFERPASHHIWETPYIAKTDGRTCQRQYSGSIATEIFSIRH